MIALMMEAARTSETLVNFYQTTLRYNAEDSHLRTHRRENLKSYDLKELITSTEKSSLLEASSRLASQKFHVFHRARTFITVLTAARL
jgi:hypothetical protein